MGKHLMISCDEATTICDKNQYKEASVLDKIRLTFHLLVCKYCRDYSKQNSTMTALFRKLVTSSKDASGLSAEEKKKLEESIAKAMKGNS